MLKERIKEIFEFTKSESPYRKANKGWISQDIFLDLSPSDSFKQLDEASRVTLFWSPINILLSNIFLVIILSSLLIFTSLSFARGKFNLNILNTSLINFEVNNKYNKDLDNIILETGPLNNVDDVFTENEQSPYIDELDHENNIDSLNENQNNTDQEIKLNEIYEQNINMKDDQNGKDITNVRNNKSNFM